MYGIHLNLCRVHAFPITLVVDFFQIVHIQKRLRSVLDTHLCRLTKYCGIKHFGIRTYLKVVRAD